MHLLCILAGILVCIVGVTDVSHILRGPNHSWHPFYTMNANNLVVERISPQMDVAYVKVEAPFNISVYTQSEACWKVTVVIAFIDLPVGSE